MKRNSCLNCDCGFREDTSLFPNLTGTWTQMALQKIRNRQSFIEWLERNQIALEKVNNEWKFPPGVCKSVRAKILAKIWFLKIDISWENIGIFPISIWDWVDNLAWEGRSIEWLNPLHAWHGRDYRSED